MRITSEKRTRNILTGTSLGMALAAGMGLFSSHRLEQAGTWVPSLPPSYSDWTIVEESVDESTYSTLNYPTKIIARRYVNPMAEEVSASLVTAGSFENYHDPTVCVGGGAYATTAQQPLYLDAEKTVKVRAFIFKHRLHPSRRILMYYWQQNRDGTCTYESRMSIYQDVVARLQTGFEAILRGNQTCILRVFAPFDEEADPLGRQTQRNVHEVSQHLYQMLLKEKF